MKPLFWHAFFLAVTVSFTEVNTVMPALILAAGGGAASVGVLTGIMVGLPLVTQVLFAGFLHTRHRKKGYLLLGVNVRVLALAGAALGIIRFGTAGQIVPVVFVAMALFAVGGAFAGVSYTDLVGALVPSDRRRRFFVGRQVATSAGLLVSVVTTRFLLGQTAFPEGYVTLFGLAALFLFVASGGFWVLRDPGNRPGTPGDHGGSDKAARPATTADAFRLVPQIIRGDTNIRSLILVANLAAPGFTAIPLLTALAYRTYSISPVEAGTFVIIQITGMLLANVLWNRLIRKGGFRLVLGAHLVLLGALFPLALVAGRVLPLWGYAGLYLIGGAIVSAQKIGTEGALLQIAPDDRRALYVGVFGAANLGTAIMPLVTGLLVARVGFGGVFAAAAVIALAGLVPLRRLQCGEWFRG
jgi:MFS family permease